MQNLVLSLKRLISFYKFLCFYYLLFSYLNITIIFSKGIFYFLFFIDYFFVHTEFFTSVPNLKKSIILYFTALHTLLPHPRLIYYHFSVCTFYDFIVYKFYILTLHFSLIYSSFCMLKDKI